MGKKIFILKGGSYHVIKLRAEDLPGIKQCNTCVTMFSRGLLNSKTFNLNQKQKILSKRDYADFTIVLFGDNLAISGNISCYINLRAEVTNRAG